MTTLIHIHKYSIDKQSLEKKLKMLIKNTRRNTRTNLLWRQLFLIPKIKEVENSIPAISDLLTTTVPDTKVGEVENKTTDVSGKVKKIDYDAKISEIEKKSFHYFWS